MKPLAAAALTALALTAAGCDKAGAAKPGVAAAASAAVQPVVLRYEVEGMHCDGCAQAITDTVKELPGTTECTVSFEKKEAMIKSTAPDAVARIKEAVERLGYHLKQVG